MKSNKVSFLIFLLKKVIVFYRIINVEIQFISSFLYRKTINFF